MEMTVEKRNTFIEENAGIIGDIINAPFENGAGSFKTLAERHGYEYDDVFNTGVMGMIEGIEKYDKERATTENGVVPLNAYVRLHIYNRIGAKFAKLRKGDKTEHKVSMDKKIFNDDGSHTTVGDMIADEAHEVEYGEDLDRKINKERVQKVLNSGILSPEEYVAIKGRFIDDKIFRVLDKEVQAVTGNPKSKAFHFINTGFVKLREALA